MIFFLSCDVFGDSDPSIPTNNKSDDTGDDGNELVEVCEASCCNGCDMSLDSCEYDYYQDADVYLSVENLNEDDQFFEIRITSNKYIKGFQFGFNDEDITITGFSGGITQESGLSPSNSENTIIAFSLSGNSISPSENQLLGNVFFSSISENINSLTVTFSDCDGDPLNVDHSISF